MLIVADEGNSSSTSSFYSYIFNHTNIHVENVELLLTSKRNIVAILFGYLPVLVVLVT